MRNIYSLLLILSFSFMNAQELSKIEGQVLDENNQPIPFSSIYIKELNKGTAADGSGIYSLPSIPYGQWVLTASAVGYSTATVTINVNTPILTDINFQLIFDNELEQVEVFGNRNDHPDKIESITRLPLKPYEQIQSISVL
ncbi:MAG TPA: carboxypeptidase-like regulatory domain-containing protein, partial [Aequorivita sp.]|nr:carboxypeptidase-like regulatory domain-containing protein [Aequorivita sp.]